MSKVPPAAYSVRLLDPGSVDALSNFFATLTEHDVSFFHPHPFTRAEAERICALSGRDIYCVAEIDGAIAAYGLLRGWDEGYDVPSLGIAIAAAWRGRGLGRLFMASLHWLARLRGATEIRLTVEPQNTNAISLYRSLGYALVPDGERLVGHCQLSGAMPTSVPENA